MTQKKAILILEDETTLSKALVTMLEREGFEVVVTEDGYSAVNEIIKTKFDLVLLDLVTPGMDGFDVLRHIRNRNTNIPVFILSNLSGEEHKKRAEEIGANKYFVKSDTLLSEVTDHIKSAFGSE